MRERKFEIDKQTSFQKNEIVSGNIIINRVNKMF